ncbi:Rieske 2Fe-2S domain-containing protein [Rarobacter faecitabidus]|uniref:Cytochrome bc1 complex Rieske iron-sulfur subunit n=1 Tax=Rarobacter faecitabidus TaxID=13243 RepID=A0A542ZVI4_RARFA|nr:Rieske 2Fe-2S domain-containing protein [Rarobacter faecitabidus]TQL64331.1 menaquinol-cytochrome c reductase iron-sulfur subunit precursor [Rarobacter faecitabidus]
MTDSQVVSGSETSHSGEVAESFQDPGIPAHVPRLGDSDPKAAKRSERIVVALFALSVIGTIGTLVAFFTLPDDTSIAGVRTQNVTLGLGLAFALLGIGLGAIHWAKTLMSDHEVVEDRHATASSPEVREIAIQHLKDGAKDSGIERRGVLKGAVVSALALFPLALAVPLIGEVGSDWNIGKFRHTIWRRGVRLATDPTGRLIKAADVTIGSAYHVIPYAEDIAEEVRPGTHSWIDEKSKAIVLMVRMDPRELTESEERKDWSHNGIVAYSKVCTHVGCPVALYERQTHHLLCPCHQSTFDMADGAKVVFGPAKRPLPQLPITVDDDGYLVAQSDFHEPVGPSFWERLK